MMKSFKLHFFTVLILTLSALSATAHVFEVDGIYYNIINGTEASVTFKGEDYDEYSDEYSGVVVIPSTVTYNGTTYTVTSIGGAAFCDCYNVTSVTIPNSVTSIGDSAFNHCGGLTDVAIPNSVTTIGYAAFQECGRLTNVVIPNSVTTIAEGAFGYCSGLTSIIIGNSVTRIEDCAFSYCFGLTSVTIPNSVRTIGSYAFSDCTGLTSVIIPNSVTSIGESAFSGCSGLASIICLAVQPPSINGNSFDSTVSSQATLNVPEKSVGAYQAADYWKGFAQIVGI